jgi:signal transduction histidine kinase
MKTNFSARILLVDDNEQNRYIFGRTLTKAGLDVVECATGTEALLKVKEQPDLVILDVKLPDISGFDVCHRIKADPLTTAIPVLQISAAFVTNESKAMALESGADGYLTHPIDQTVVLSTVRSLLRLRQFQLAAQRAADEWRVTFDTLREGVAVLDGNDCITRFNNAFQDWIARDFPNSELRDLHAPSLLEKALQWDGFEEAKRKPRFSLDSRVGSRWFRMTLDGIVSEHQRVGSVLVIEDITEQMSAQEMILTSERLAATGRLANTIAHEINNPLEAVTNLVFLAARDPNLATVRHYLEAADRELNRVSAIARRILAFNRESHQRVKFSLADLAQEAFDVLNGKITSKALQFSLEKKPAPEIVGLPGEIRQVLLNLTQNAVEATDKGGHVCARVRAAKHQGRSGAAFIIFDTGSGIPISARPHIFEPFFTTKELKGSGLGLWVSAGIVAKHGGSLRMRSTIGGNRKGTCFRLFLPAN